MPVTPLHIGPQLLDRLRLLRCSPSLHALRTVAPPRTRRTAPIKGGEAGGFGFRELVSTREAAQAKELMAAFGVAGDEALSLSLTLAAVADALDNPRVGVRYLRSLLYVS